MEVLLQINQMLLVYITNIIKVIKQIKRHLEIILIQQNMNFYLILLHIIMLNLLLKILGIHHIHIQIQMKH